MLSVVSSNFPLIVPSGFFGIALFGLQDREVLEVLGTQKDNEYKTPWRSQNLLGLPTRQAS